MQISVATVLILIGEIVPLWNNIADLLRFLIVIFILLLLFNILIIFIIVYLLIAFFLKVARSALITRRHIICVRVNIVTR